MGKKKFVDDYIKPIFFAILIALFIRAFIIQAFKIPSSSMEPTLLIGDHILVNKFIYGVRIPYSDKIFGSSKKFFDGKKPQRGDIVVFIYPKDRSKDFIKRVIGTEGDKVEIVGNKVFINNKEIDDPWGHYDKKIHLGGLGKFEYVDKVPKGHLFVLGDNRDNSQDSRFWGFVNISDVKGRAFIIYFSGPSMFNILFPWTWGEIKWMRFGKLIH
jgi:signal peptidase I